MVVGKRIGKYLLLIGIIVYFAFATSPVSMALLGRLENRYSPLLDTKGVGKGSGGCPDHRPLDGGSMARSTSPVHESGGRNHRLSTG
jgi:hypothetical protein